MKVTVFGGFFPLPRKKGATRSVRFGAWNSPPQSLPQASGWDSSAPTPKESLPLRTAYHEIGHLLGFITSKAPVSAEGVRIARHGSGWTELRPRRSPLKFTPQDKLNLIIGWDAGETLERMVFGSTDPEAGQHDRLESEKLAANACAMATKNCPALLPEIQHFLTHREAITRSHLMQFSRQTIDWLAQQLRRDKHWDAERIRQLRRKFKLGAVVSAKANTSSCMGIH